MTTLWHTLSPTQAAAKLNSDLENGLTTFEAQARLARYGPNKLPELAVVSPWRRWLSLR